LYFKHNGMSSTNNSTNVNSILEYIPVWQVQFCCSTLHDNNNNDFFVYLIKRKPTLRKWSQKLCDIDDIFVVLVFYAGFYSEHF